MCVRVCVVRVEGAVLFVDPTKNVSNLLPSSTGFSPTFFSGGISLPG